MASEEAADWRVGLTFQQRLSYMLDGKYSCDVTFLVGQGEKQETVHCHRFPLIAGSAVFEDLLENNFKQEITFPDVEPAVFKTLIKYLYSGELKAKANNVMALMHVGNKYSIADVTKKCSDFLKTEINPDNVCTILEGSIQYGETSLTERCLKLISEKAAEHLGSKDFTDLSKDALLKIIERDELCVEDEIIVYKACMMWANAECKRRNIEATDAKGREVLGEVFFKIRFPAMLQAKFAEISRHSELLTEKEKLKIFEHMVLDGKAGARCHCKLMFNKTGRHPNAVTVSRFDESNDNWQVLTSTGAINAVHFSCSKPCMIEAVGVFCKNNAVDREMTLRLLGAGGYEVSRAGMVFSSAKKRVRVYFPRPVNLAGGNRYSLVTSNHRSQSVGFRDGGSGKSVRVRQKGFEVTLQGLSRSNDSIFTNTSGRHVKRESCSRCAAADEEGFQISELYLPKSDSKELF